MKMRAGVAMKTTAFLVGIFALQNVVQMCSADDDEEDDPRKPTDYNELRGPDIVGEDYDY